MGSHVVSIGLRRWLHRWFWDAGQSHHLGMGIRMWDPQISLKLRDSKYVINVDESFLCLSGLLDASPPL